MEENKLGAMFALTLNDMDEKSSRKCRTLGSTTQPEAKEPEFRTRDHNDTNVLTNEVVALEEYAAPKRKEEEDKPAGPVTSRPLSEQKECNAAKMQKTEITRPKKRFPGDNDNNFEMDRKQRKQNDELSNVDLVQEERVSVLNVAHENVLKYSLYLSKRYLERNKCFSINEQKRPLSELKEGYATKLRKIDITQKKRFTRDDGKFFEMDRKRGKQNIELSNVDLAQQERVSVLNVAHENVLKYALYYVYLSKKYSEWNKCFSINEQKHPLSELKEGYATKLRKIDIT